MKPLWLNGLKYTLVALGSIMVFIALVVGAAGVHAAINDHRITNVEQTAEQIGNIKLGHAIMPIVQAMYDESVRQMSDTPSSAATNNDLKEAVLKQKLNEMKEIYPSKEDGKIITMLDKWVDTGFTKNNWLQVRNDTWHFMKKAVERYEVYWSKKTDVPQELKEKLPTKVK